MIVIVFVLGDVVDSGLLGIGINMRCALICNLIRAFMSEINVTSQW